MPRRRTGWFALVTLVVAFLAGATSASADTIVECGSVITVSTVLTHDLRGCEEGLTVAASDVTLDLGGHQLTGSGVGVGVNAFQATGVVVRNGAIRGFERGLVVGGGTVSELNLASNGVGVVLFTGRLEGSLIHQNGTGVELPHPNDHIVGNRILNNAGSGIFATGADNSVFEGNLVMGNGGDGLHIFESTSTISNNTLSRNGGDGLFIDEDHCGFANFYRVAANLANGNGALGINVSLPSCAEPHDLLDQGGNAASRNGDVRECTVVECASNRGQAKK
jgi:parallel beta-helix repeat protein